MLMCEYDVMDYMLESETNMLFGGSKMDMNFDYDFGFDFTDFNKETNFSEMDESQWDYYGEDVFGEDYDDYKFEM